MIIYGWKRYVQVLAVLTLVCQQCALPSEHVLRRLTTKFTLFFIPLFPVNRKHTVLCTACEHEARVPKEQAMQLMASGGQGAPPPHPGPPAQAFGPPQGPPPQGPPPYGVPPQGLPRQGPPQGRPPMAHPPMQGPRPPHPGQPHPGQPYPGQPNPGRPPFGGPPGPPPQPYPGPPHQPGYTYPPGR